MKTFLHYSREKQLEEGILGNISSGAGKVVGGIESGMAKVGDMRDSFAKSGLGAMLGQKGGSSADAFKAGTERAQASRDEKKQKQKEMNIAIVQAEEKVKSAKKALQDAISKGKDTRIPTSRLRNAEKYFKEVKKAQTPEELENITTQYYADRARRLRAMP